MPWLTYLTGPWYDAEEDGKKYNVSVDDGGRRCTVETIQVDGTTRKTQGLIRTSGRGEILWGSRGAYKLTNISYEESSGFWRLNNLVWQRTKAKPYSSKNKFKQWYEWKRECPAPKPIAEATTATPQAAPAAAAGAIMEALLVQCPRCGKNALEKAIEKLKREDERTWTAPFFQGFDPGYSYERDILEIYLSNPKGQKYMNLTSAFIDFLIEDANVDLRRTGQTCTECSFLRFM